MRHEFFEQSYTQLLAVFRKRVAALCVLLFSVSATAQSERHSHSIDDLLPPENRICGMLTRSSDSMNQAFVLTSDSSLEFSLDAPTVVIERFIHITQKYPTGIYICVPANPNTIPNAVEPLRIEWFAYIDPGSSGISVVNQ